MEARRRPDLDDPDLHPPVLAAGPLLRDVRMIQLAELPYGFHSLEPHLSAATLQAHHEKHHAGYVKRVNELVVGTPFERATLDEIVALSGGPLYDAAAQA